MEYKLVGYPLNPQLGLLKPELPIPLVDFSQGYRIVAPAHSVRLFLILSSHNLIVLLPPGNVIFVLIPSDSIGFSMRQVGLPGE